jgi:nicotinamidase-related amidase
MNQPALIVIDMLNDFLRTWAPAAKQRLVQATNRWCASCQVISGR